MPALGQPNKLGDEQVVLTLRRSRHRYSTHGPRSQAFPHRCKGLEGP
jgi:hypothetical protein